MVGYGLRPNPPYAYLAHQLPEDQQQADNRHDPRDRACPGDAGNVDHAVGDAAPEEQLRAQEGRANDPFEIHVISMDAYSPGGIQRLEELGVTDVIVGFRWTYDKAQDTESLQTKVDHLNRYADTMFSGR